MTRRTRPYALATEVYADAAMDRACPNCHAAPNDWCTRPDGEIRSVPCIARMRATDPNRNPQTERN